MQNYALLYTACKTTETRPAEVYCTFIHIFTEVFDSIVLHNAYLLCLLLCCCIVHMLDCFDSCVLCYQTI